MFALKVAGQRPRVNWNNNRPSNVFNTAFLKNNAHLRLHLLSSLNSILPDLIFKMMVIGSVLSGVPEEDAGQAIRIAGHA